jgi:hypothetical protein
MFGRYLASFVMVNCSVEVVRVEHTGKEVDHVSYFLFGKDQIIAKKKTAVLCLIWYVTRGISWLLG